MLDEMTVEWSELKCERPPAFPSALLPRRVQTLVEALAASIQAPVDYVACAALGAASSALVGRVLVKPCEGYTEPVNLFCGLCGESGTKKSPCMRPLIAPLRAYLAEQNRDIRERNAQAADKREQLRQQARRADEAESLRLLSQARAVEDAPGLEWLEDDTTPESLAENMSRQGGRGIFFSDEGNFVNILAGACYGKQGGVANIDIVLKGYDGDAYTVSRKGAERLQMEHAHLALTIGLQPEVLSRMADNPELASRGLPQRLLFFYPEPLRGVNVREKGAYPSADLAWWAEHLTALAASYRDHPLVLPLTHDAREEFLNFQQSMQDRAFTDLGGAMRQWSRKAAGKAARLAGLMTMLEDPSATFVEQGQVRAAVALMESYFIPMARSVFGGDESLTPEQRSLLEAVMNEDSFSEASLYDRVRGQKLFKGPNGHVVFNNALAFLQTWDYVRQRPMLPSAGRGRKPSPIYDINPHLRKASAGVEVHEGVL